MCIGRDLLSIVQTWLSRKGETNSCVVFLLRQINSLSFGRRHLLMIIKKMTIKKKE